MIAGGFTCQRYGFNVGADKFSLLTIENGKTSIMRLSEWTLISQSQKSHSDRLLVTKTILAVLVRQVLVRQVLVKVQEALILTLQDWFIKRIIT